MLDLEKWINIVNKLKDLGRSGWKTSNIEYPESIAEHSYHVGIYSLILSRIYGYEKLDLNKVLILSIIHDIAEAYMGDIPSPYKTVKDMENEKRILMNIVADLMIPEEWVDELFNYASIEAMIVKLSDLLATIDQGIYYIKKKYESDYLKEIILNSYGEAETLAKKIGNEDILKIISYYDKEIEEHLLNF
jgi:putative hydrolase of HD superfamily